MAGVWSGYRVDQGAVAERRAHIKKKPPSMYHQFHQLAGLDITKEPMEVGPTTHYVMGGVKVEGDTQMSTVPGLFAAGEVAAGLPGESAGGTRCLTWLCSVSGPGSTRRSLPRRRARRRLTRQRWMRRFSDRQAPFERGARWGRRGIAVRGAA